MCNQNMGKLLCSFMMDYFIRVRPHLYFRGVTCSLGLKTMIKLSTSLIVSEVFKNKNPLLCHSLGEQ